MSKENGVEILDIEALKPPKRIVKFGRHRVNVSVLPFEIYLEVANNWQELAKLATGVEQNEAGDPVALDAAKSQDVMERAKDLLAKMCEASPSRFNRKWLDKLDITQLLHLLGFMIRPMLQTTEAAKNALAAGLTETSSSAASQQS